MFTAIRVLICAVAILLTVYQTAFAGENLVCNLSFGSLQQVSFWSDGNGVSYATLNNVGRRENGGLLPQSQWDRKNFELVYRGKRFRIFSSKSGTWEYEIYLGSSRSASTAGYADCE